MNENQMTQIREYLLDKKLPIDILIEVQDHFAAQIQDMQRTDNMSFEQAFSVTRQSWHDELKPYWKGGLNLEEVSDFMRRMRRQHDLGNLNAALKGSLVFAVLILAGTGLLPTGYTGLFVVTLISLLVLFAVAYYIRHRKNFRLSKQYEKYVLTMHQHSVFIFFIILSPYLNVVSSFLREPDRYQDFLLFQNNWPKSLFVWCTLLLVSGSVFFSISAQQNYLRQIEKVKPFLKYLQPSS